jgi:hypothetical protein
MTAERLAGRSKVNVTCEPLMMTDEVGADAPDCGSVPAKNSARLLESSPSGSVSAEPCGLMLDLEWPRGGVVKMQRVVRLGGCVVFCLIPNG